MEIKYYTIKQTLIDKNNPLDKRYNFSIEEENDDNKIKTIINKVSSIDEALEKYKDIRDESFLYKEHPRDINSELTLLFFPHAIFVATIDEKRTCYELQHIHHSNPYFSAIWKTSDNKYIIIDGGYCYVGNSKEYFMNLDLDLKKESILSGLPITEKYDEKYNCFVPIKDLKKEFSLVTTSSRVPPYTHWKNLTPIEKVKIIDEEYFSLNKGLTNEKAEEYLQSHSIPEGLVKFVNLYAENKIKNGIKFHGYKRAIREYKIEKALIDKNKPLEERYNFSILEKIDEPNSEWRTIVDKASSINEAKKLYSKVNYEIMIDPSLYWVKTFMIPMEIVPNFCW